jgi:hypothetical protein
VFLPWSANIRMQDISHFFHRRTEEVAQVLMNLTLVEQLAWREFGGDAEESAKETGGGGQR